MPQQLVRRMLPSLGDSDAGTVLSHEDSTAACKPASCMHVQQPLRSMHDTPLHAGAQSPAPSWGLQGRLQHPWPCQASPAGCSRLRAASSLPDPSPGRLHCLLQGLLPAQTPASTLSRLHLRPRPSLHRPQQVCCAAAHQQAACQTQVPLRACKLPWGLSWGHLHYTGCRDITLAQAPLLAPRQQDPQQPRPLTTQPCRQSPI